MTEETGCLFCPRRATVSGDVPRKWNSLLRFTLIELLIVVGIIGILAALLLPALAMVKYKAKLVYCMNNQKQVANAAFVYASDNNTRYPHREINGNGANWSAPETILRSDDGNDDRDIFIGMGIQDLWCPFTGKVDFSRKPDKAIYATYEFYFSYLPDKGTDSSAMNRLNKVMRSRDGTEFSVLAADIGLDYWYNGEWQFRSSHPDRSSGALYLRNASNSSYEASFWAESEGAVLRGPIDRNFVFSDGHAELFRNVGMDDQPRTKKIDYKYYSARPMSSAYRQLPANN